MVRGCNDGNPIVVSWKEGWGKKKKVASAVPGRVREAINLNTELREMTVGDVTRLFGAVWSSDNLLTATHGGADYLPLNYLNDDDQITMAGIDAARYRNSCASIVSGTAGANGEYDVGAAALKAVLESSYKTDAYNRLDLVTGSYESPVVRALTGQLEDVHIGTQRFVASMALWRWYETDPSRVAKPGYLIRSFNGDALYRKFGSSSDARADLKTDASLGGFGAKATVGGAVSSKYTDSIAGESYAVAIARDGERLDAVMYQMPTAAETATTASGAASFFVAEADQSPIVAANSVKTFVQAIQAFPAAYCGRGVWESTVPLTAVDPVGTTASLASGSRLVTCNFTFAYKTTAADVTNKSATVQPVLSRKITPPTGAEVRLALSAQTVSFTGANVRITPQDLPGEPTILAAGEGKTNLMWRSTWLVSGGSAVQGKPVATSSTLTCEAPVAHYNQPVASVGDLSGSGSGPKSFQVTWTVLIDAPYASVSALTGRGPCKLGADFEIPTASTAVAQTITPFDVKYPVAAPQTVAATGR
jgi:hypothetical protein